MDISWWYFKRWDYTVLSKGGGLFATFNAGLPCS
jgi:hypothetical protein